MKTYLTLLALFTSCIVFSQHRQILSLDTKKGKAKNNHIVTNKWTTKIPINNKRTVNLEAVGKTAGELAISSTGAATYLVPLVLPPGIKEVVPSLALSYNSQNGNGIAGWGWNIAGLSSISRIGATQFHDGRIDPVDFDEHDRFALDGQRLILVEGESYGADGSVYQTEQHSNLKIVARSFKDNDGLWTPSSFTVYYPDGARALYGSFSALEWGISQWIDPQGNRIIYTYDRGGNSLRISEIFYGSNSSLKENHPNSVKFNYKNKDQVSHNYIGGLRFFNDKILESVSIYTKDLLYRDYQLTHDFNTSGYERLIQIQESTSTESNPPIEFNYDINDYEVITIDTDLGDTNFFDFDFDFGFNFSNDLGFDFLYNAYLNGTNDPENVTSNSLPFEFDPQKHQLIPGDFNGNGAMDFVLKKGGKYSLFNSNNEGGLNLYLSDQSVIESEDQIYTFLPATFETEEGKIKSQQGFISINEAIASNQPIDISPTTNEAYSTITFTTHVLEKGNEGVSSYSKSWKNNIYLARNDQCNVRDYRVIPKSYYPGDFDGDGRTDVLMIEQPYAERECPNASDQPKEDEFGDYFEECDCNYTRTNNLRLFMVDMDRKNTEDFVHSIGALSLQDDDKIELVDFDGDGIAELWKLSDGKLSIYSFSQNNRLSKLLDYQHRNINLEYGYYFGDYNGDGKTDLLFPIGKRKNDWQIFYGTGESMIPNLLNNTPIIYEASRSENHNKWYHIFPSPDNYTLHENFFIPQDVNGDGITDMIEHKRDDETARLRIYLNETDSTGIRNFRLIHSSNYSVGALNRHKSGTSFGVNRNVATLENTFYYIIGKKIFKREFHFSNQDEMLLRKVTNKGLIQDVYYEHLRTNPSGSGHNFDDHIYKEDHSQLYPYVNINTALSIQLTQQVITTANGQQAVQKFNYYGAVSHAGGLGFLGFMGVARSNTFGDNVRGLWQISIHDPQKRGAMTHNWTSLSRHFTLPENFQKRSEYEYTTLTGPKGIFINVPQSILTQDGLMGFETLQTFEYDPYYNPSKILTDYFSGEHLQGSRTQTYSYSNKASALDNTYHIGRLKEEVDVTQWGEERFFTSTQYQTYNNNLLTQMRLKGDGTDWLSEQMTYDPFGNLLSKVLSAEDHSDRRQSYTYTPDGRFLASNTDIEGLTTQFTYYEEGTLESETDPFGWTTTYYYDPWQRPSSMIDYLNNTATTTYTWNNNTIIETQTGADGSQQKRYIDPWGRTIHQGSLALKDKWRWESVFYDVAGRVQRKSEPYYATTPSGGSHFNYSYYDAYRRVEQQVMSTGKVIQTTYTRGQPTTLVHDGYQEVHTTLDARGNILTMTDPNGTIHYSYHPNGELLQSNYDGHVVKVGYDAWGRKSSLSDPSAGDFSYTYDIFGQLTEEVSPWGTTTYGYDATGKLDWKKQLGDDTQLSTLYHYDPRTRLLTREESTDRWNGDNFIKTIQYDTYQRPVLLTESNNWANFTQRLGYDTLGRLASDQRSAAATGAAQQTVNLQHHYAANGMLSELVEMLIEPVKMLIEPVEMSSSSSSPPSTGSGASGGSGGKGHSFWKLKAENARGQATQVQLGNGIEKNMHFDDLGFLDHTTHGEIFQLELDYDKKKGVLNGRTQKGHTSETFTHDSRNRLTGSRQGEQLRSYNYDHYGRMSNNSQMGEYHYAIAGNRYRLDSLYLNAPGAKHYQGHPRQTARYNIDRKATHIHEEGHGRADFIYNSDGQRLHAFYGSEAQAWDERPLRKHYASIFPAEITVNQATGSSQTVLYLGGDAYTAPVALINGEDHYLHRDHLGSILGISNASGVLVEERHFTPWGTVDYFAKNGQVQADFSDPLLPRGFTGHEHFEELDLLHMNGRLYDPQLRRFLAPDNHIQDPYDSRSYDRFAYVWQNPLMSSDPTGEFIATVIAVIKIVSLIITAHQLLRTAGGYATGYYTGWRALASAILQVGLAVLNVGKAIGSTLFSTTTLSVGQTIATAAITGFISGTLGAVIAGANIGDALKSGLVSAGIAAALAALATHGAKVKARRKGSGMADKSSIALRQRLEEVVPNAELQGISAQDLAHNTQEKWGAKRLTLGELNNIRAIEVNGKNINPDGFILSNASLRNSVKSLYIGLESELGYGNFEFQVTGGDRYGSMIDGKNHNLSSTKHKTITIGKYTAHNIEKGARAVDLRIGLSYTTVEPIANSFELYYQKGYYPYNYNDGHHHLYLLNYKSNWAKK